MRKRRSLPWYGVVALMGLAACGGGEGGGEQAGQTPAEEPASTQPAEPAAPAGGATTAAAGNLPAGVTPEMVQQGQQIFNGNGNCYTCHGQNGAGGPLGPNLADAEWIWITPGSGAFEQMVGQIKTGVSTPKQYPAPMPAMGGAQLSEEQLRSVTAYVYSLNPSSLQGG